MHFHLRPFGLSLVLVGIAATAQAQSYSSFTNVGTIHGITLSKTVNNGVASYTVSLSNNAYYSLNNTNYSISNIFGFFELFNSPVTSVIPSSYSTPSGWSEKDDIHGHCTTGQLFGYENNPKSNAITSIHSVSGFQFLNSPSPDSFGFHVTSTANGNTNTYFIKGNLIKSNLAPTAEVSSLAVFGALLVGGCLALRRQLRRPV